METNDHHSAPAHRLNRLRVQEFRSSLHWQPRRSAQEAILIVAIVGIVVLVTEVVVIVVVIVVITW
jgi:hypothetical protein